MRVSPATRSKLPSSEKIRASIALLTVQPVTTSTARSRSALSATSRTQRKWLPLTAKNATKHTRRSLLSMQLIPRQRTAAHVTKRLSTSLTPARPSISPWHAHPAIRKGTRWLPTVRAAIGRHMRPALWLNFRNAAIVTASLMILITGLRRSRRKNQRQSNKTFYYRTTSAFEITGTSSLFILFPPLICSKLSMDSENIKKNTPRIEIPCALSGENLQSFLLLISGPASFLNAC